jgi:hypothetical protein
LDDAALVLISLVQNGKGRKQWKAELNAFDTIFDGRLSAGRQ